MEMNLHTIDAVAERIVSFCAAHKGDGAVVLALSGDLGAGKTTLVQSIAKTLGVTEVPLSPTFVIMKTYSVSEGVFKKLTHIDAYRIESEEEFGPLRLDQVFGDQDTLVCIEWPERLGSLLPEKAIRMKLNMGEGDSRVLEVPADLETHLQNT